MAQPKKIIAPSILAADWTRLAEEVSQVVKAGADWLHLDVMDGHFVPPITFGPQLVRAVQQLCATLPSKPLLDVHLMIERPELQLKEFAAAGADIITVHVEACPHLHQVVREIKALGCQAGVAINPGTALGAVQAVLGEIDLLLVMSVNPGWGGQEFIPSATQRLAEAAQLIAATSRSIFLEVDGGINKSTAALAAKSGANVFVAGTAIFSAGLQGQAAGSSLDYREAISAIRQAIL